MPANKAVCVSELSASLPSLPATQSQPWQPHNPLHSLPRLNRGTLGWGWQGKGKPPSKNIRGNVFLLPLRVLDSPTPHCREAIPSSQTSTSPSRWSLSGHWFRKIWDLKEKGLGRGGECIPERAGLPFVSLYSPLFKDTRWRFSDESGKLGEARTRDLF